MCVLKLQNREPCFKTAVNTLSNHDDDDDDEDEDDDDTLISHVKS